MQTVVIGGHAHKVGKTSVLCGLLRDLAPLDWTAVKITQHEHEPASPGIQASKIDTDEQPFVLFEEKNPRGQGDTCRFLAAGARRALWLRIHEGQLSQSFPSLTGALGSDERVMIESNSVLDFLEPSLYLLVLDSGNFDFKISARRFLARADALVAVGPQFRNNAWPDVEPNLLEGKPVFSVTAPDYYSRDLCGFVRERVLRSGPAPLLPFES